MLVFTGASFFTLVKANSKQINTRSAFRPDTGLKTGDAITHGSRGGGSTLPSLVDGPVVPQLE